MIKFLDYGGYLYVPANSLRALRQDFMVIPFQAVEVYLDNVVPSDSKCIELDSERRQSPLALVDQEEFTSESIEAVKNMLLGFCFKAIVTGYHYDSNPFVQLTNRYGHVNDLAAKPFARYVCLGATCQCRHTKNGSRSSASLAGEFGAIASDGGGGECLATVRLGHLDLVVVDLQFRELSRRADR